MTLRQDLGCSLVFNEIGDCIRMTMLDLPSRIALMGDDASLRLYVSKY